MSAHNTHAGQPVNEERRRFMETAGKFGFTAAVTAGAGGVLMSRQATAQTAQEENERKKAARYTMTMATAYIMGASRSYPIMQLDFKENIQNMTNGQVYVKLAPGGQLGAGGALAQKVQTGTIQVAQHSLSNFAPFAPVVDLINLPYFCGANQKFVNLVTSDIWKKAVHPMVEAKGFKPLWYVVIDPRVVAVRKGGKGPVKTPDDLSGVKFRVPGSKMLQQYYRMLGANPTPVAWGETPAAIKQGVADALDPAARAVPDSQVYSCNLDWFNSLPGEVREGIEFAGAVTARQNLAKVPAARSYAMAEMAKQGVQFYSPNEDELAQWVAKAGHQLPAWNDFKTSLAGDMKTFERLNEAANTPSGFYVHDA